MPYDPRPLFEQISACLNENPRKTLEDLAQSLHVSKRTIKKTVRLSTGGNFRRYREEVLIERVKDFFAMQPGAAIKVLSIDLGFKSPSSFARAVRRASGACPGKLRKLCAQQVAWSGKASDILLRAKDLSSTNTSFKQIRVCAGDALPERLELKPAAEVRTH
jgi:AraC-like DNA-binding protein